MAKDLLKEYNRKRDFRKTKEPSGKRKRIKTNKNLSFVIQEHHARRLHYDFRLELEGVLKSWAVPKGPSLDPKDKRLAVQTEDHPYSYKDFHGTIPEGEYGGGDVYIWDEGTWEPEVEDPILALENGHLKFRLHGNKLNGSFVLVRTHYRGDESKKNWLLIKHKDEEVVKGYELKKIASSDETKKTRKKISTKQGRDKWPGFIEPQLPRLVTQVPAGGEWIHEMKLDGYRMQAHLKDDMAKFFTRRGLNWSKKFPTLLKGIETLPVRDAIFDGEIVAFDEKGRTDFQALQNSLKGKGEGDLQYYIFDLLYLNGSDLRRRPLEERKKTLQDLLKDSPTNIIYSEDIKENGQEFYKVSCEHELEGIVSKLKDSSYVSGRSDIWAKTKCSLRQEFVIGGWTDPKDERAGIGSLLLGVYEEDKLKYVGKVGTGFNQKTLKTLKKELSEIEIDKSPFDLKSPKGKDIHWIVPDKVCEISFGSWTKEGILRTPVFQGLREDKSPQDISREKAKKKAAPKHLSAVRQISSPEKILFRDDKKTKKDVLHFYQLIAKDMLPYIAHRPLSLVRCPNGGDQKCFFQKHISGSVPDSFHITKIKEGKGEGTYISIDSAQGLQDLVQLNAFELHVWNGLSYNYTRPDQIVMDFDPDEGVEWKEVVEAALELRELLIYLELESFVKVTGGKGLHVHIPVAQIYDWDQLKSFAQTLALELVSRNPQKYTAKMSKKMRKNKIFIDYLRNGYGATAVAPYSLRAKSYTAVAMPVDWKELKRIKNSDAFSMDKAIKKIKARKKDPWEGMLELNQEISILTPVEEMSRKAA